MWSKIFFFKKNNTFFKITILLNSGCPKKKKAIYSHGKEFKKDFIDTWQKKNGTSN